MTDYYILTSRNIGHNCTLYHNARYVERTKRMYGEYHACYVCTVSACVRMFVLP